MSGSSHAVRQIGKFSTEQMAKCLAQIKQYKQRQQQLCLAKMEKSINHIAQDHGLSPATVQAIWRVPSFPWETWLETPLQFFLPHLLLICALLVVDFNIMSSGPLSDFPGPFSLSSSFLSQCFPPLKETTNKLWNLHLDLDSNLESNQATQTYFCSVLSNWDWLGLADQILLNSLPFYCWWACAEGFPLHSLLQHENFIHQLSWLRLLSFLEQAIWIRSSLQVIGDW